MRILWVKAGKLLPVDTGGKIRSYNILRHLALGHKVTLLSYYGGKKDPAYETAVQRELPGTQTICTGALDGNALAQSIDYLRRVSEHVSIGRERKKKGYMDAWFVLVRQDLAS